MLAVPGTFPNLGIYSVGGTLCRLSDDWKATYGHPPSGRPTQGRRHKLATVLAICVLARLAGRVGGGATPRYAKTMPQEHLAALDTRRDRVSGFIPPLRDTINRVTVQADRDEVQVAANRWARANPVSDPSAL